MSKQEPLQFIYHFEPIRPELVTDPDAWTEEDKCIGGAHFAYLQKATQDEIGPAIVIFEVESEGAARSFMENDPFVAGSLVRK